MSGRTKCRSWKLLTLATWAAFPLVAFTQTTNVNPADLPAGLVLPAGFPLPPGITLPPGAELPGALRQGTNAPAKTNAPVSPEEKRLQELLKLQYDRRPPALLDAFAKQAAGNTAATNEVLRFQADVVAGNWSAVRKFLSELPEKHRPQVYKSMLEALDKTPSSSPGQAPQEMPQQGNRPPPQTAVLFPDDILALADAGPGAFTDEQLEALGKLLTRALSRGNVIEPFLAKLETGTERLGGSDPARRESTVKLLMAANRLTDAGKFLPPLEPALATNDLKAIDLHARYCLSVGKQKQDTNAPAMLRKTWDLTQATLTATNCGAKEREQALNRAIELMPLLAREIGTNWLVQTFESKPDQGMAILAAVGTQVGQGAANRDTEVRRKNLELQRQVVEVLLSVAGDKTTAWKPALNVLALGWTQEAEYSKNRVVQRRGPSYPQFDQFGNQVFYDGGYYPGMNQDPNQLPPVPVEQIVLTAPGEKWLALLDTSLVPRLQILLAELQLKAEDEEKALPYLETVAREYPKAALNLANEVLRAWARTHDPNPQNTMNRYGPYGPIYYGPGSPYGMNPLGAPLTRAMQARNIGELSKLLERLKRLPLDPLDQKAVVGAFSSAHSRAEVFRVQDIEAVFGPIDQMRGETLSELLQTMRERLAGQWRAPRVQQEAKTKRNDKEIEAEVTRGYELVLELITQGLAKLPNNWRMHLVHGAAMFDWAEFDYGKKVDLAIYVEKRDRAFQSFEKAASLYAGGVSALEEKDQTPLAFQQWFNATLGASDLAYITRQTEPNTNHLDKIRLALFGLPSEVVERHVAAFGKGLTDSINTLKPELKPRYLRAGIRIVGDHESAAEARKLATYYDDLLQEIVLDVRVDGDSVVGHGKPFGVFVALRHSEALGRESGGFGKYLQNPQNMYYNPYGRAPVNYREDFEKQVREKFGESFEVLSILFQDDKVQPRGYGRPLWRETPYAYLLLKAKDGSVDRIPPLQLDLDFFDKRGQVILPVASQVQLIDARPDRVAARPVQKVDVLQILDDRDLSKGALTLEIKAGGRGLLPELKDLLDLRVPGFRIDKTDDRGLSLIKMDAEGDQVAPVSERNWMLMLVADPSAGPSKSFLFPKAVLAGTAVTYKRYSDADLVEVKPEAALAGVVLKPTSFWVWIGLGVAAVAVVLGLLWWWRRSEAGAPAEMVPSYSLPNQITPFTVLNLLQRMQSDAQLRLNSEQKRELSEAIAGLQQYFFSRPATARNGKPDLEQVARRWVSHTR